MRTLPARQIQAALMRKRGVLFHDGVRWFPVIDRLFVPDFPMKLVNIYLFIYFILFYFLFFYFFL